MNANNEKIYNAIISKIEENKQLPWNCPFIAEGFPKNYVTGKSYHGRNLLMLYCASFMKAGFMTYIQAKKLGANIKKGEHGFPILHAESGWWEEKDDGTKEWHGGHARVYYVFNVSQIENLPNEEQKQDAEATNTDINKWINSIPVTYKEGFRPHYNINDDYIGMPNVADFKSEDEYYATIFHEMIHWTGAGSRLNRPKHESHGDERYSYEELIAELGSAILRSQFHIDNSANMDNSVAYLESWLKVLKDDKEMLFKAMADAEKAVSYLNDIAVNNSVQNTARSSEITA